MPEHIIDGIAALLELLHDLGEAGHPTNSRGLENLYANLLIELVGSLARQFQIAVAVEHIIICIY